MRERHWRTGRALAHSSRGALRGPSIWAPGADRFRLCVTLLRRVAVQADVPRGCPPRGVVRVVGPEGLVRDLVQEADAGAGRGGFRSGSASGLPARRVEVALEQFAQRGGRLTASLLRPWHRL